MTDSFSNHRKSVIVESVIPLTDSHTQAIRVALNLAADTPIENRHNPNLIAGLRVHYHGKIIDLSFQNQLNQLKA
jgi:F0F1-type ATP synthase delta subunit